MTTDIHRITVAGVLVEVVRKDIKNLHLGVYPPHGRVRVAAPLVVGDDAVRLAVIDKLGWIRRQRDAFACQPRQSQREMVSGESHYAFGKRYRLRVHEVDQTPRVALRGIASLDLFVRPGASEEQRAAVLLRWYREQLKAQLPALIDRWQRLLRVKVEAWGVKRMKTKWGSCNPDAARVWFNLELAKKPLHCVEYIVAHELAHLRVRSHDERFVALLDEHLPDWQMMRAELNRTPLGHEDWR